MSSLFVIRAIGGLLVVLLACAVSFGQEDGSTDTPPVAATFRFLAAQQDLFHEDFILYDDRDSGAIAHLPSGMMGDLVGLPPTTIRKLVTDSWPGSPFAGTTSLRFYYPRELAQEGTKGWTGLFLQYPDGNWGKEKGLDLSRYNGDVTLTFQARASRKSELVEFQVGGVNAAGDQPELPHRDTVPASKRVFTLTEKWGTCRIPISTANMSSWIGGFCCVASRNLNSEGCEVFVDEIRLELSPEGRAKRLSEPRLIRSYVPPHPHNPDRYFRNVCFCYDQALAICAFVARGPSRRSPPGSPDR